MRVGTAIIAGLLAACSPSGRSTDDNGSAATSSHRQPPTAATSPVATPAATSPDHGEPAGSCAAELGRAPAQKLADRCRDASPATHPPCNVANSCATMRDEIRRSCNLFAATDPLPATLCTAGGAHTPDLPTDPAAVIRTYYSAIGAHDYARAYRIWWADGRASGQTLSAFAAGFGHTAASFADVGTPAAPEGAAGSVYVTVPVTVTSTTTGGAHQRFTGSYVLRRANHVPGATASDRAWHIASANLERAP